HWSVLPEYRRTPVAVTVILAIIHIMQVYPRVRVVGLANHTSGAAKLLIKLGAKVWSDPVGKPVFLFHPAYHSHLQCLCFDCGQLQLESPRNHGRTHPEPPSIISC